MNKRDTLLDLIQRTTPSDYVPAAFFLHFNPTYHQGGGAIEKQLEFFNATGMDFIKIQFEQHEATDMPVAKPEDWANMPRYGIDFFEPTLRVVEGLVKAMHSEALVVLTVYSPFMWLKRHASDAQLRAQFRENPDAVKKGLDIMTENVVNLVRGAKQRGIDGFYASSQGGEAFRFPGTKIFETYIKPSDLTVWGEMKDCTFNILHVCDFEGGYDNLCPFMDYPGQVVNCSLKLGDKVLTPKQVALMFGRPFMGGMDRHGVIATGGKAEIRQGVEAILAEAPDKFILGADCTVPNETPWENLKTAIDTAHQYHR